ncbi:type II toxin-antitoxin system HicA family toxin [Bdellovibrionota bacterium FG-2]
MTKATKLKAKLKSGSIDARELRELLKQEGWALDRVKGSHEFWEKDALTFVFATHSKDLNPYQVKQARAVLLPEGRSYDQEED